jgi:hypothetical protein
MTAEQKLHHARGLRVYLISDKGDRPGYKPTLSSDIEIRWARYGRGSGTVRCHARADCSGGLGRRVHARCAPSPRGLSRRHTDRSLARADLDAGVLVEFRDGFGMLSSEVVAGGLHANTALMSYCISRL